ncbi:hypothetical protein HMI54_000871 [Coelomomyces lativittatus]|nr:hypothetical protein HMI56_001811 [Coelomomyces lativittatus]KAJ1511371.1 hypothetical protein HMI54_000871 [Coelomomyces lativittatus]KAJ1517416.1 hypothetical protein HMI55_007144 [Coelomomyces lativittatus]
MNKPTRSSIYTVVALLIFVTFAAALRAKSSLNLINSSPFKDATPEAFPVNKLPVFNHHKKRDNSWEYEDPKYVVINKKKIPTNLKAYEIQESLNKRMAKKKKKKKN